MPITRSAKKALRQSLRRRTRNLKRKEAYKNAAKNLKKLTAAGKVDDARKLLPQLYKVLDKAAKTRVIHQNKAGRLKSRLTKLIAKARPDA
jgi:small subunit ribosomal protein S20